MESSKICVATMAALDGPRVRQLNFQADRSPMGAAISHDLSVLSFPTDLFSVFKKPCQDRDPIGQTAPKQPLRNFRHHGTMVLTTSTPLGPPEASGIPCYHCHKIDLGRLSAENLPDVSEGARKHPPAATAVLLPGPIKIKAQVCDYCRTKYREVKRQKTGNNI